MMRKTMIVGWTMLLAAAWPISVGAEELARWNSTNAVKMAGTFAPTSQHVNVSVSNLVASTNLLLTGSGAAEGTFAAGGYSAASSNEAKTAGHYWETVIQPKSGYSVSFNEIAYRFRRSGQGPQWAQWAYSLDGVNFVWTLPPGSNNTGYAQKQVSLNSIAALQDVTGRVWFRMYAWQGSANNDAWGVFGQNADVLIFSGTVESAGPVVPSIYFNPSGSQSIAVSNTLTLEITIVPTGSGMKSWTFLPSNYAGTASMSNNSTFRFTPYGADNGKPYTLAVVATNSVGSTTGTVAVSVTAYEPPVPVVTFSPTGTYSIMATYTQKLGVGVTPAGSGIASWSLVPTNYSGTATLVGTNFSFITAQTDGPSNYTLSVIATNVFGARTGTAAITVTEYIPPPPPGSIVVDFEDAPNKNSYVMETNTLSGRSWLLSGATSSEDNDRRFGTKALRIRSNTIQDPIKLCSRTPFTSGIESITLWFAAYRGDGTNKLPKVSIQISTNIDTGWFTLDTFDTGSATSLVSRSCVVKIKEPVYFRLWSPSVGTDNRANIDNIIIAPFVVQTNFNAFLMQYNVTPGDPGTAEGDDLDGDGATNLQEYNAAPKTNPYDPASHP